jgi:hypothetical protein
VIGSAFLQQLRSPNNFPVEITRQQTLQSLVSLSLASYPPYSLALLQEFSQIDSIAAV